MSTYNKVKTETLEILEDMGTATTHEVALITNRRYEAAAMAMLQYYRFGLLHRHRIKGEKTYIYSLSNKGIERLDYLRSSKA